MSVVVSGLSSHQPLDLDQPGAFYNRHNVDFQKDFDPLRNRHSYSRKESQQWAKPTGNNQFQQYSKVVDEHLTDAPDVHRCQRGKYEFLTSHGPASHSKASRSEQSFQETRRLQDGSNRKYHFRATSVKVQSFTTTTTTTATSKHIDKGPLQTLSSGLDQRPDKHFHRINGGSLTNSSHKVDDLELCILDVATAPLDHSLQIDKKNLSKNGSLGRRRRPSRSIRRNLNMTDFYEINQDTKSKHKSDENFLFGSSPCSSISTQVDNKSGKLNMLTREVHDKAIYNNNNNYQKNKLNDEMKDKFKEAPSSKEPDLIRDVKMSKDLTKMTSSTHQMSGNRCISRQPVFIGNQRTNEEVKTNDDISGNWLQEAKQRLRKNASSSVIKVNGTNVISEKVTEISIENGCVKDDEFENVRRFSKQSGHKMSNDIGGNGEILIKNIDLTGKSKSGSGKPKVSFDGVVHVNSRRHSADYVESDGEQESENYQETPPNRSTSNIYLSLEKNKSKSTSNLDDDETIEAPWFIDLKNQKQSEKHASGNKKLAKSSMNLRWTSNNGVPLIIPISNQHNDVQPILKNKPADNNSVRLQWDNKVYSDQKPPIKSKNTQTRKVLVNGQSEICSGRLHLPLITTGVIPQRLSNVRKSDNVTHQQCASHSHLCRNQVNDKVVIVEKYSNMDDKGVGTRIVLSNPNQFIHGKTESDYDKSSNSDRYQEPAHLPKEDLTRRTHIDWDSLDRRKNSRNINGINESNWLHKVKLKKTNSFNNILDDSISKNSMSFPSETNSSKDISANGSRPLVSPGLTTTLVLDSESSQSTDDERALSRNSCVKRRLNDSYNNNSSWHGEESEVEIDMIASMQFGDELSSAESRRNSFYESETWQKLEETLKQANQVKYENNPEWVKEAEKKKHSWFNLTTLDLEGETGGAPSWLNEMKQKRSTPVHRSNSHSSQKNEKTENDKIEIEIIEKNVNHNGVESSDKHAAISSKAQNSRGTGWTFVPSDNNSNNIGDNYRRSTTSLEYSSSMEEEMSEAPSTFTIKSSDLSLSESDLRRQIQVDHSNFDVENYVRDLISRRRAEGVRKHHVETPTPPSCSPDWLQRSLHVQNSGIDWNRIENSHSNSVNEPPWVTEIQLRPVSSTSSCNESFDLMPPKKMDKITLSQQTYSCSNDVIIIEDKNGKNGNDYHTNGLVVDLPSIKNGGDSVSNNMGNSQIINELEFVKLADAKGNKNINWNEIEEIATSHKICNASPKWITQVQLKPVPSSPKDLNVITIASENDEQQQNIKIKLRHVISPIALEMDRFSFSQNANDDSEISNNQSTTEICNCLNHEKSVNIEPDWFKVAWQKKQAQIDWERLGSLEKFDDFTAPIIKEENRILSISTVDNSIAQPSVESEAKNNSIGRKSSLHESLYRTWVVSKQNTSNSSLKNNSLRWQSEPQLNSSLPQTPNRLKLEEKQETSETNWSSIDQRSPLVINSNNWIQEVSLKSPPVTSSQEKDDVVDFKCTSPFPVQLRHVEKNSKPTVMDSEKLGSPWSSRSSSTEVDKWQIRYRELFDDLSDEEAAPVNSFFDDNNDYQHPPNFNFQIKSPSSRLPQSSVKLKNIRSEDSKRKQQDFHCLNELTSTRDVNDLEIINKPRLSLSTDKQTFSSSESSLSNESITKEETSGSFIKLKSTVKKPETENLSKEAEPLWLKEIKLRKVEKADKKDYLSNISNVNESMEEYITNGDGENSRITKQAHISYKKDNDLTIRDVIHRDIKLEVARREQKMTNGCGDAEIPRNDDFSTSIKQKNETSINVVEVNNNKQAVVEGGLNVNKPLWLEELQLKKCSQKQGGINQLENKSLKISDKKPHAPSFGNVLDEIKSKGKDKLFAGLKRPSQDGDLNLDSSSGEVLDTMASRDNYNDDVKTEVPEENPAKLTTIDLTDLEIAVTVNDNDGDYLINFNSQSPIIKHKPCRPITVPITVDHFLQQHSQQLMNNRLTSMKPVIREDHSTKTGNASNEILTLNFNNDLLTDSDDGVSSDNTSSSDDLKSPLLLLNMLSKFGKSNSEMNMTAVSSPSLFDNFEVTTSNSKMTFSCSDLVSTIENDTYVSWSNGFSNLNGHNLKAAPELDDEECESYTTCKSQLSLQLQTSSVITSDDRHDSEISLD